MKVLRKIQSELRGIKLQLSAIFSSVKSHVKNNVPYVSQFAHPDFAEKILKDAGIQSLKDILKATVEDLVKIPGIGKKMAGKIIASAHRAVLRK